MNFVDDVDFLFDESLFDDLCGISFSPEPGNPVVLLTPLKVLGGYAPNKRISCNKANQNHE